MQYSGCPSEPTVQYDERFEHGQNKKFIKVKYESGVEDVHYSMFCDDFPQEMTRSILKELNETEENKRIGMQKLREFIKKENLTYTGDDDNMLLTVLRTCKYNLKKSEAKLKKFLKARQKLIYNLSKLDEKMFEAVADTLALGILPYRDKYGRIIIFSRPALGLDAFDPDLTAICVGVLLLFILSLPGVSVFGKAYIGECKGPSMYILYFALKVIRRFIPFGLDMPLRVGRIDVVNENVLIRLFVKAVRPILPEKIKSRLFFLGNNYKDLHEFYHPNLLPEEFDGTLGPFNDQHYRQKLLNFLQTLKSENEDLCN